MNEKQFVKDFEFMRNLAEATTLSKISLERPLSDSEFKRFRGAMERLGVVIDD